MVRTVFWVQLREAWVAGGQRYLLHASIGAAQNTRVAADPLAAPARCLHAVPALDDIGLQANWARFAVQFQEKTTRVAQDAAVLVAAP